MQLLTLAVAAALSATVSANAKTYNFNSTCDEKKPRARIINRCDYAVNVWSVDSDDGNNDCGFQPPAIIEPGGIYQENYRQVKVGGISIKISKEDNCKSQKSITQLEYRIETEKPGFNFNSLDVSYVDCTGGDCPTRQEGYYLVSGNQDGKFANVAEFKNECPIISCHDADSCAQHSYILPDDVQTKTCDNEANLDFYMCGGDAPGSETESKPSQSPEEQQPEPSQKYEAEEPKPSSEESPLPTVTAPAYVAEPEVAAAAVTEAPQSADVDNVKTVYETVFAYTTVQPHAHRHRRRHRARA